MRKKLAILVIICFVINMAGTWLLFGIYQQEAKETMKCFIRLNPNTFNTVHFKITLQNVGQFNILDGGDEVSCDGIMYDIITKKEIAGNVELDCVKDLDETNLVNAHNKAIEKQHDQSSNSKSLSQHSFLNQVYDDIQFSVYISHPSCLFKCPQIPFKQAFYYYILKDVAIQPPQWHV